MKYLVILELDGAMQKILYDSKIQLLQDFDCDSIEDLIFEEDHNGYKVTIYEVTNIYSTD